MKGNEREKDLVRETYYSERYFSYSQLWSFIEQIHHLSHFHPQKLLEIGVGNGFVSSFFKSMGINVTTFDINPNLMPDIVASLQDINSHVVPDEFDLISCCEVLEHMPFEVFTDTIEKFSKLSDRLFLTLPVYNKYIGFGGVIKIFKFKYWGGVWLKLPFKVGKLPTMHFWEIDYTRQTSKKEILRLLNKHYQKVEAGHYKANPYHYYFICAESKSLKNHLGGE